MKKAIILLAALLSLTLAEAQQVSEQEAKAKAEQFFGKANQAQAGRKMAPRKSPKLALASNRDEFYVYNDQANGGYVIISGDERTPDVLGYSYDGHYNAKTAPCNMQTVLDGYAEQVTYLRTHPEYKMPARKRTEETKVAPLLGETAWNQGWPYNNMCPIDENDGLHYVTGCSATATAQVMYYHKWPERGKGNHSYEWHGQTLYTDFSQSVYRWDLMTPTYDENSSQESCDAVALLMKDVGYAYNTDYEDVGSGGTPSIESLIAYFDYDVSIASIGRGICDADSWHRFIMDDLQNGQPVLYSGASSGGAHALVIDGYDGDGYYHFNFGWGGASNGNYTMLSIPYNISTGITIGIKKNEGGKPSSFFGTHEDFIYNTENNILEGKGLLCSTSIKGRISIYNALAVENVYTHETRYLKENTISSWNELWNAQYHLSDMLPDGNYILYPVARLSEDEPWHKFMFYDGRQSVVDLNVTNGQKTYTNNHLSDPIQDGAVEIGNIYYYLDDNKHEATVTFRNDRYASYSGDVTIPTTVEYNGQKYVVTEIGETAFEGSTLGVLRVAKTIRAIGEEAFNTVKVDKILFEKGSELKEIKNWAFHCCDINSGQMDLPEGLEQIGGESFYATYAPWVSIPKSVTDIATGLLIAFDNTVLRNLSVQWETPQKLWRNPFWGYDLSLCTLYVPKGTVDRYSQADIWKSFGHIIEMGDTVTIDGLKYMLFENDYSATILSTFDMRKKAFSIPSFITYQGKKYTVKQISPFAFAKNTVEELTIPSSVEYIGEAAFQGTWYSYLKCLKLCHKNPPMVADMTGKGKEGFNAFIFNSYNLSTENFQTITLYVPSGCKTRYQSDSFWGQFKKIVEYGELVINGDFEGPDFSSFADKNSNGIWNISSNDIVTENGNHCLKIVSQANAVNTWDSQFFIKLPKGVTLPAGTEIDFSMRVKASRNTTITTQGHDKPEDYLCWGILGNINVSTDWRTIGGTFFVPRNDPNAGSTAEVSTIAFDLNYDTEHAIEFFFDDISIKVPGLVNVNSGIILMDNVTLTIGEPMGLTVSLSSEVNDKVGIQFDVTLPDGISLDADSDGKVYQLSTNQANDMTCTVRDLGSGVFRFALFSNTLQNLKEGELLNLRLKANNGTALGYYSVSLSNIAFSDLSGNIRKENWVNATVKVTDFFTLAYVVDGQTYKTYEVEYGAIIAPEPTPVKKGYRFSGWSEIPETMPAHDVTVTGTFERHFDVGDVVKALNYVLGDQPTDEDLELYDMNGDGGLNVADIILMVKKILEQGNSIDVTQLARGSRQAVDLTKFTALQLSVDVPEGSRLGSIRLAGDNSVTHQLMYQQAADGSYTVVVWSMDNQNFSPVDGRLIEVTVEGGGEAAARSVLLADKNGERLTLGSLPVGTATEITTVCTDGAATADIYDLRGNKVLTKGTLMERLPKGVYIMDGKTIIK